MWPLLLLAIRGAAAGSCKDHSNRDVDWWVAYNPANSDRALFLSSTIAKAKARPISLDAWLGNDDNRWPTTPVWNTLNSFDEDDDETMHWMGYNDDGTDEVKNDEHSAAAGGATATGGMDEETEDDGVNKAKLSSFTFGPGAHAKGQVLADSESLVWMPHSCPKFFGTATSRDASKCHRYGQHFACYTMPTAVEDAFISHLWFANIRPRTEVPDHWVDLRQQLLYGTERRPSTPDQLRGVRTRRFETKGHLKLHIAACGFHCENAMADTDLGIRPNRLHCRLYDRLAASPRYGDKNFLVRSWNREADPAPQKLLGRVGLPVDDPRMFPTLNSGKGTEKTRGSSARAGNVVESIGGWVSYTTKEEGKQAASGAAQGVGAAAAATGRTHAVKELLSWKRNRNDHAKFMVSTDEDVICFFDMNHYQARAGTSVCMEDFDIARFWGTLVFPPKDHITTPRGDKRPALYYPTMGNFDLTPRTEPCSRRQELVAGKSFIATSGSDADEVGGATGDAQPTESIYSVCDEVTGGSDRRTPRVRAATGKARTAEHPEGVNGIDTPAAGPPAPATDGIPPCVQVQTLLGYATCNPSSVSEGTAFSNDPNKCNGVREKLPPRNRDDCKPLLLREFINYVMSASQSHRTRRRGCDLPDGVTSTLKDAYDNVTDAREGNDQTVFGKEVQGLELDFSAQKTRPCNNDVYNAFLTHAVNNVLPTPCRGGSGAAEQPGHAGGNGEEEDEGIGAVADSRRGGGDPAATSHSADSEQGMGPSKKRGHRRAGKGRRGDGSRMSLKEKQTEQEEGRKAHKRRQSLRKRTRETVHKKRREQEERSKAANP